MTKTSDKTAPTAFDFGAANTIEAMNHPYKLQLKHPVTSAPLPAFIWHLGNDSDAFNQALDDDINEKRRKAVERERRGEPPEFVPIQEQREGGIDLLVAAIIAADKPWEGIQENGQDIPFDVPHVKAFLLKYEWVKKQVDKSVADIERFLNNPFRS